MMENYRLEILKKRISQMPDHELFDSILHNPEAFAPEALELIGKEIESRQIDYKKLEKLRKKALKYARNMLTAESDMDSRGFLETRDPYSFFYWLWIGMLGMFMALLGSFYLAQQFDLPLPPVIHSVLIYLVAGSFLPVAIYFYKKRSCPKCKKPMIMLKPSWNESSATFKYVCNSCGIFINTKRKLRDGFFAD